MPDRTVPVSDPDSLPTRLIRAKRMVHGWGKADRVGDRCFVVDRFRIDARESLHHVQGRGGGAPDVTEPAPFHCGTPVRGRPSIGMIRRWWYISCRITTSVGVWKIWWFGLSPNQICGNPSPKHRSPVSRSRCESQGPVPYGRSWSRAVGV